MTYPVPYAHDRFAAVPEFDPGKPKEESEEGSSHKSSYKGVLRQKAPPRATAKGVWLKQYLKDSNRSTSFQNVSPSENPEADAGKHFHYLPGHDKALICWQVESPHKASKARFELWSATDEGGPVWFMEKKDDEAVSLLQGKGDGDPSLSTDDISIDDGENYPDKLPNLANAPYQVRLIVTDKDTGAVSIAWSYFDILIDKLELYWGPEDLIPDGAIPDTSDTYEDRVKAKEKQVLQWLKGKKKDTDVEDTRIPTSGEKKIFLEGLLSAYYNIYEWSTWRDMHFLRHQMLWGQGPRLPIIAKIYLKPVEGDGVHSKDAAKALGKAQFLWDWEDKPFNTRTSFFKASHQVAGAWQAKGHQYLVVDDGTSPPGCHNCHVDRGGKRAGADRDRIFLNDDGTGAFPFKVEACQTRKWASLSGVGKSDGDYACCTGVLFSPSRMALDSYKLSVFPVVELAEGKLDDQPTKRASERIGDLGVPVATTPLFEVWRMVSARYIRKDDATPAIDLTKIDDMYESAGIAIDWLNNDPSANFSGFWDKDQFNRLVKDAFDFQDYGLQTEKQPPVAKKRYPYDVGKRKNAIVELREHGKDDTQGLEGHVYRWDHWFGRPKTDQPLNTWKACTEMLTFPGYDIIIREVLRTETKNYIDKNRWRNDKKSKWNKFKDKNPGRDEEELLEEFFYDVLSSASQKKVMDKVTPKFTRWPTSPEGRTGQGWVDGNFSTGGVMIASELHQRKTMEDDYEGVSFFHYLSLYRSVGRRGGVLGKGIQYGGKADLSADLGLRSSFFVADHPTTPTRSTTQTPQMDGNMTAAHEFGHVLHLPHAAPTGDGKHQKGVHVDGEECIMNYNVPDRHLCGCCRLRLMGWAFFKDAVGDVDVKGFSKADPSAEGDPPIKTNSFFASTLDAVFPDYAGGHKEG